MNIFFSSLSKSFVAQFLLAFCLVGILPLSAFAFNSGKPNFEIVVTDSLGRPITSQKIELLVELTQGSLQGQVQYAETHVVTTSPEGVAAFPIGYGQPTDPKYIFNNFDIGQGDNFLRLKLKESGGMRLLLNSEVSNVPKLRKWLFANEKHNTVIAVLGIVLLGIVLYLLFTGRKVGALEKQLKALKQRGTGN